MVTLTSTLLAGLVLGALLRHIWRPVPKPVEMDQHRGPGPINPVTQADPVLSAQIKSGISRQEFLHHLQPIRDLRTNRIMGMEALARWHRADGTILLPEEFLPQLEGGSHHLPSITDRVPDGVPEVLQKADPDLFCAINVSTQFLNDNAHDNQTKLENLLNGLNPSRTVVEIVENAVINDINKTASFLSKMRARGIRIALDDFGTGHSNLDRLRDLPIDMIKLDRSFITNSGSRSNTAFLNTVIQLARDLQVDLIAEGVETEEHANKLRALGFIWAQGFHLGAPAPVETWRDLISLTPEKQVTAAE